MNKPVKRIMVYIDGTEQSITAVQYAICLAKNMGAEIFAIYVVNTKALSDLVKSHIFLKSEHEEYQQDLAQDALRYLSHARELARNKGLAIECIQSNGTVHLEIKEKLKEYNIDLLIIGELSHIRSRRDEFYNEAERVMRSATCPVLIVNDEERVWEIYDSLE